MSGRRIAALFLCVVFCSALFAPSRYAEQSRDETAAAPSWRHWLGTDDLGRDLFVRLLYGTRVSLLIAPVAALFTTALAAAIGGVCGYLGGPAEALLLRAADLLLALPWLLLLLIVRAVLPLNVAPFVSIWVMFTLFALLGWASPALVIRAGVRSLRSENYVRQALAFGCGPGRLLLRHLLPNLRGVLAAQFWMAVPVFILSEANLGFLGLGVGEPLPSWGNLLRGLENIEVISANPWRLAPAVLLLLVVACFRLLTPMESSAK